VIHEISRFPSPLYDTTVLRTAVCSSQKRGHGPKWRRGFSKMAELKMNDFSVWNPVYEADNKTLIFT
jgi:hypothetical protein